MSEWRSPGALLGVLAIVVSVVLFFVDKLVPDENLADGLRRFLDAAGQAAPWVIVAALVVLVVYMFRHSRKLVADLNSTRRGQGETGERMRQLEAALTEAKKTPPPLPPVPGKATVTQPTQSKWASMSKGGVVHLALPNGELETMYGRAIAALNERGLEGRLTWLEVFVYPYSSERVSMTLSLYSDRTRRDYSFWMNEAGEFTEDDVAKLRSTSPGVFKELPWREQPKWCVC